MRVCIIYTYTVKCLIFRFVLCFPTCFLYPNGAYRTCSWDKKWMESERCCLIRQLGEECKIASRNPSGTLFSTQNPWNQSRDLYYAQQKLDSSSELYLKVSTLDESDRADAHEKNCSPEELASRRSPPARVCPWKREVYNQSLRLNAERFEGIRFVTLCQESEEVGDGGVEGNVTGKTGQWQRWTNSAAWNFSIWKFSTTKGRLLWTHIPLSRPTITIRPVWFLVYRILFGFGTS